MGHWLGCLEMMGLAVCRRTSFCSRGILTPPLEDAVGNLRVLFRQTANTAVSIFCTPTDHRDQREYWEPQTSRRLCLLGCASGLDWGSRGILVCTLAIFGGNGR